MAMDTDLEACMIKNLDTGLAMSVDDFDRISTFQQNAETSSPHQHKDPKAKKNKIAKWTQKATAKVKEAVIDLKGNLQDINIKVKEKPGRARVKELPQQQLHQLQQQHQQQQQSGVQPSGGSANSHTSVSSVAQQIAAATALPEVQRPALDPLELQPDASSSRLGSGIIRIAAHKRTRRTFTTVAHVQTLHGHEGVVWAMQFSADGRYLATAGQDAVVRVWAVSANAEPEPWEAQESSSTAEGGCGSDKEDDHAGGETAAAVDPLEEASAQESATARLEGEEPSRESAATADDPGSSDAATLSAAVAAAAPPAAPDPAHASSMPPTPQAQMPTASAAAAAAAAATTSGPYFSSRPVRQYTGHTEDVLDLAWSGTRFLLSASTDKSVRLWHMSQPACLRTFWHPDFVTCVTFHPRDHRRFASGAVDGKIRLWDVPEARVAGVAALHQDMVTAVAFAPDGGRLVAGTLRGKCRFYECGASGGAAVAAVAGGGGGASARLEYVAQIDVRNARGANASGKKITRVCAVPGPQGGRLLIASNDSRLRLYQDYAQKCKYKGLKNGSTLVRAGLSPDGRHVVSGSDDGFVYLWELEPHAEVAAWKPGKQPCFESFQALEGTVITALVAPDTCVVCPVTSTAPFEAQQHHQQQHSRVAAATGFTPVSTPASAISAAPSAAAFSPLRAALHVPGAGASTLRSPAPSQHAGFDSRRSTTDEQQGAKPVHVILAAGHGGEIRVFELLK